SPGLHWNACANCDMLLAAANARILAGECGSVCMDSLSVEVMRRVRSHEPPSVPAPLRNGAPPCRRSCGTLCTANACILARRFAGQGDHVDIVFHGAAGEVTGSCHLVEVAGRRVLLDCGMVQGDRQAD